MTTVAAVIERTRRHLYSGETRDERNRLSGSLTSSAVGLGLVGSAGGIAIGSTLAIDLEELYVWNVTGGTNCEVSRGEGGSTAATHDAGATIFVNPKFSAFAVLQAINEELVDLSAPTNGLFDVGTVTLDYVAGTDAYDLTSVADLIDVISVEYDAVDGTERWRTLPRSAWRLRRDMPSADFPSGLSLTVNGYAESGADMRVSYRKPFAATLSTLAQVVETVSGIDATATDILSLGAAIRLLAGTEVARNFLVQGDTRRADEVPPQARASQMRALQQLRSARISAEKARLYAKYPVVR